MLVRQSKYRVSGRRRPPVERPFPFCRADNTERLIKLLLPLLYPRNRATLRREQNVRSGAKSSDGSAVGHGKNLENGATIVLSRYPR